MNIGVHLNDFMQKILRNAPQIYIKLIEIMWHSLWIFKGKINIVSLQYRNKHGAVARKTVTAQQTHTHKIWFKSYPNNNTTDNNRSICNNDI